MVATGFNLGILDHVEVINTQNYTSCPNLPAPYPFPSYFGAALNHNSKMVICGGYPYTTDCYSYSDDQWNIEAFKLEPAREGAMSVEIRPGEWLVMGGYDSDYNFLNDTKLLKNGIFIQGPDLPEPIYLGSATMLNETHLFVAGSQYQSINLSTKNYLLDVNTGQWTQIAERNLTPSFSHSSGTFFNSTAGETQVVNVGFYGIEVYSPKDNFWHRVPFPPPLYRLYKSVAIQRESNSFILIGGETNLEKYSGDLYLFDENGFSVLNVDVLQIPRYDHVALPIAVDDFSCDT